VAPATANLPKLTPGSVAWGCLIPQFKEEWIQTPFYGNELISQSVSALLFVALCGYVWFRSLRRAAS